MKSREEILERFVEIQQWKNIADRQHTALVQEFAVLRKMSERSTNNNDVARQWNEEHRQQCSRIKSLETITIPGFCANQNTLQAKFLLEGMLASFAWVLEVGP